jgi:hypothetical protein
MNPNDVAPMVVGMTFLIVGGGTILLRPLVRRLADLIDVMVAERRKAAAAPPAAADLRLQETVMRIEERLRLLEERQDFTDSLLTQSIQRTRLGSTKDAQSTEP